MLLPLVVVGLLAVALAAGAMLPALSSSRGEVQLEQACAEGMPHVGRR